MSSRILATVSLIFTMPSRVFAVVSPIFPMVSRIRVMVSRVRATVSRIRAIVRFARNQGKTRHFTEFCSGTAELVSRLGATGYLN